jgi:aspartate-semialdehyde dehydrogenase
VTARLRAAVIGASGDAGVELVRLLLGHPRVELAGVYAASSAGKQLADVFPHLAGVVELRLERVDVEAIARGADVVFSALPMARGRPPSRRAPRAGCASSTSRPTCGSAIGLLVAVIALVVRLSGLTTGDRT